MVSKSVSSLLKVKAHRGISSANGELDLKQILGNLAVDFMADKCISDHIEEYHGNKQVARDKAIRAGTR